jgi:DNA-binding CsgD family transcriptional regulator
MAGIPRIDDAEVARLTAAGRSAREIADRLGTTARTVARSRVRAGIAQDRTPALTEEQLDTARRLLEDGAPYDEAARTIGCSRNTLAQHFPGHGLTPADKALWRTIHALEARVLA